MPDADDALADGFLRAWHRVVAEKDRDALLGLLADDVSLGAPPYWSRIGEREVVHHLLGLILDTIEGFTYRREWVRGRELALECVRRGSDVAIVDVDVAGVEETARLALAERSAARVHVQKLDVADRDQLERGVGASRGVGGGL